MRVQTGWPPRQKKKSAQHTMTAPQRDWQEHNRLHIFNFEAALSLRDLESLQVKKKKKALLDAS